MKSPTQGKLPPERHFGILFSVVFAVLASYALYQHWSRALIWVGVLGFVLTISLTVFAPQKLAPANRLWFQLGLLLGRIVSPLVLGLIFFGILTPVSLVTRLFGRDELRLKKEVRDTYWIVRSPPGPEKDSFTNQF
jgi:hypothetical protein